MSHPYSFYVACAESTSAFLSALISSIFFVVPLSRIFVIFFVDLGELRLHRFVHRLIFSVLFVLFNSLKVDTVAKHAKSTLADPKNKQEQMTKNSTLLPEKEY